MGRGCGHGCQPGYRPAHGLRDHNGGSAAGGRRTEFISLDGMPGRAPARGASRIAIRRAGMRVNDERKTMSSSLSSRRLAGAAGALLCATHAQAQMLPGPVALEPVTVTASRIE